MSQCLASGDLLSLEESGVVDKECLEVVRRNLSLFKPQQRAALAVDRKDIYFAFVYQVGTTKEK